MSFFSTDALNPGVRKREVFGWAMYDFANSGYTTVVLTAVFAAYFVGAVAGGAVWATFAWTLALSVSHAIVMMTMPAMGAWADRYGAKKRLLMFTTTGCVLSTAALAFVGPGMVALAVLFAPAAYAQTVKDADPAIWVVRALSPLVIQPNARALP